MLGHPRIRDFQLMDYYVVYNKSNLAGAPAEK